MQAEPSTGKPQEGARPGSGSVYVRTCQAIIDFASLNNPLLGSKKIIRLRHAINFGKALTLVVTLALMFYYKHTHHFAGWLYVALHGSYGILWISKDCIFPDPRWDELQTAGGFVSTFLVLAGYWIAPYYLNAYHYEPGVVLMFSAAMLYILGVSLMLGSDCQKYYQLKYSRGLISDGFFAYTRNPNYFGEMTLYSAFAMLSGHWLPWLYLGAIWTVMFFPNMYRKDASLSRYPQWAAYCSHSGMLIPDFGAMCRDLCAPPKPNAKQQD